MWPVNLTLAEKKRLLASCMVEPSCRDCRAQKKASHVGVLEEANLRLSQSSAVSDESEVATCGEQDHGSRSQSNISGGPREVQTAPVSLVSSSLHGRSCQIAYLIRCNHSSALIECGIVGNRPPR